jgi:hypothetical protein
VKEGMPMEWVAAKGENTNDRDLGDAPGIEKDLSLMPLDVINLYTHAR